MSGFALRHPVEEHLEEHYVEAEEWLDSLITDYIPQFEEIYNQPHTGEEFWRNVLSIGIPEGQIMSDLKPCIEMRKLLKPFKKRMIHNIPILFGGIRGKAKTKTESRSNNPEGLDNVSTDKGMDGSSTACELQEHGLAGSLRDTLQVRAEMGRSEASGNEREQIHGRTSGVVPKNVRKRKSNMDSNRGE
jgi:hypothetical protein